MLVFVRQILRINADRLVALLAAIGEDAFVALDAVGVLIPQHVALTGERLIALPAAEVAVVPVLVHRLGVFAAENKLVAGVTPGLEPFGIMPHAIEPSVQRAIRQLH